MAVVTICNDFGAQENKGLHPQGCEIGNVCDHEMEGLSAFAMISK